MDAPPVDDCCSVCHDRFTLPCQANCSHWFCGECILRVWHHGFTLQPCKCPICRRSITLLIPCQTIRYQRREPEVSRVLDEVQRYNRLFGDTAPDLIQRFRDVPFFLRRLVGELMDPHRSLPVVIRTRMIIEVLLSFLYLVSPMDLLPEGVLGFVGFIDDIFVLLVAFLHLSVLYRSVLVSRHSGR
ncbi:unnamed protein product [Spirodela intermedia]|uniref:E3 ubiquitin-protein ligase RNF170 n=1 Tax=Spirodela intermedia TaxID=51605 RepID=A0A7I8KTJ1_SPIIN|nr:unnamed protein product [Spirodela intermedia]